MSIVGFTCTILITWEAVFMYEGPSYTNATLTFSSIFNVSILKCVLQKVYSSLILADLGDSGGPAGFIYGFLFVWAGTLATYASLGELSSMLYPPRTLDDLVLTFQQGSNCRWSISLGVNACSTKLAEDSQLYNWYTPSRPSAHSTQLISRRLVYCYRLASIICHSQFCLSSTYSRLDCFDSAQLRP